MKATTKTATKKKFPIYNFSDVIPEKLEFLKSKTVSKLERQMILHAGKPVYIVMKSHIDRVDIVNDSYVDLYTTFDTEIEFNVAKSLDTQIKTKISEEKYNPSEIYTSCIYPSLAYRGPQLIKWRIDFEDDGSTKTLAYDAVDKEQIELNLKNLADTFEHGTKCVIIGKIRSIDIEKNGPSSLVLTLYQIVIDEQKEYIQLNSYIGGDERPQKNKQEIKQQKEEKIELKKEEKPETKKDDVKKDVKKIQKSHLEQLNSNFEKSVGLDKKNNIDNEDPEEINEESKKYLELDFPEKSKDKDKKLQSELDNFVKKLESN